MRPLNLATQPFRNETLPAVLFGTASFVLLAVTVHHAFVVRGLLPARTSQLHKEVAALEEEAERLRAEARAVKTANPEPRVVAEWGVLKDLVDRRTFSWTGLFAHLEQVLPREVRLVSIAPDVEKGEVTLEITAVARPPQAGLGLVGLLEGRREFEDVYPMSVSEQEGGIAEFQYTMRYLPDATDEPTVTPAAAEEGEEPPTASPEETTAPASGPAAPAPAGASPPVSAAAPAATGPSPASPPTRRSPPARLPAPASPSPDPPPEEW
jgi:hypothetical protein